MLIFDSFPNRERAEAFQKMVENFTGQRGFIYDSQAKAAGDPGDEYWETEHDIFHWQLDPPIVLIRRTDRPGFERAIENLAPAFGGVFAGT